MTFIPEYSWPKANKLQSDIPPWFWDLSGNHKVIRRQLSFFLPAFLIAVYMGMNCNWSLVLLHYPVWAPGQPQAQPQKSCPDMDQKWVLQQTPLTFYLSGVWRGFSQHVALSKWWLSQREIQAAYIVLRRYVWNRICVDLLLRWERHPWLNKTGITRGKTHIYLLIPLPLGEFPEPGD